VGVALFLGLLSMVVSFVVVQQLAGTKTEKSTIDPKTQQRARLLRLFSNELVSLCNDYHRRVSDGVSSTDRTWLDRTFRRDLQFLEERMDDTMPRDAVEFLQLRASAFRCAAMARNPDDAVLRARTLEEVAHAVASAESYILRSETAGRVGPPRVVIHFQG